MKIMRAKNLRCPYCNKPAQFVNSAEVYQGVSYGNIYLCRPCDAYVGVHHGTVMPLGTMAKKDLREARVKAHTSFDCVWKMQKWPRKSAYAWLCEQLQLEPEKCHMGSFDIEQCSKVVTLCDKILLKVA